MSFSTKLKKNHLNPYKTFFIRVLEFPQMLPKKNITRSKLRLYNINPIRLIDKKELF